MSLSKQLDLDALEKLHAASTPGEWWVQKYSNYTGWSIFAPNAGCIAERWYSTGRQDEIPRNDLFIAAAHNQMPALIRELRELRDLVGLLTAVLRRVEDREAYPNHGYRGQNASSGEMAEELEKDLFHLSNIATEALAAARSSTYSRAGNSESNQAM